MKLCFVIFVFISVIFTVGEGEVENGIIREVNSPNINRNKVIQSKLDKEFEKFNKYQEERHHKQRHPPLPPLQTMHITNSTNSTDQPKTATSKTKKSPYVNDQNQNNDTDKKLIEEQKTIDRVIVVLGSLGAALILIAIAIAVLYCKVKRQVKRQQDIVKIIGKDHLKYGEEGEENTNDDNNNNNNNSEHGKRDNGSGVGSGVGNDEPSINISEKSNRINTNSPGGVNNGVGVGIVTDKVDNVTSEYVQIHNNIRQLSPQPTAPPADKLIGENNDLNIDDNNISTPPLTAPPAYTPTAPPIYALPHIPIDDMILYTDGYQQSNSHHSEMNNNNSGNINSSTAWHAAGSTSQTDTPVNEVPYQHSNPTIIRNNPLLTTNLLYSSLNSHENNDNDRSTHQRQSI